MLRFDQSPPMKSQYSMDSRVNSDQTDAHRVERRPYTAPELSELGSVLELTRGAGSSSLDFDRLTRQRG